MEGTYDPIFSNNYPYLDAILTEWMFSGLILPVPPFSSSTRPNMGMEQSRTSESKLRKLSETLPGPGAARPLSNASPNPSSNCIACSRKRVGMAISSTDFWDDSNIALQPHWQWETQVEGLGSKSRCRDGNQVSTKSEKLPEHFNPATDASRDLPAQGLYKAGEGGSKAQPSWWSPSKSGLPLTYLRCKKTMQKSSLRRVLFMPTEQTNCKSEAAPPEIPILVCSTAQGFQTSKRYRCNRTAKGAKSGD